MAGRAINTFKYAPFGQRIEKSSSATTSIFAYDGDNLIEKANPGGTVVARYSSTQEGGTASAAGLDFLLADSSWVSRCRCF